MVCDGAPYACEKKVEAKPNVKPTLKVEQSLNESKIMVFMSETWLKPFLSSVPCCSLCIYSSKISKVPKTKSSKIA